MCQHMCVCMYTSLHVCVCNVCVCVSQSAVIWKVDSFLCSSRVYPMCLWPLYACGTLLGTWFTNTILVGYMVNQHHPCWLHVDQHHPCWLHTAPPPSSLVTWCTNTILVGYTVHQHHPCWLHGAPTPSLLVTWYTTTVLVGYMVHYHHHCWLHGAPTPSSFWPLFPHGLSSVSVVLLLICCKMVAESVNQILCFAKSLSCV